MSLEKKSIIVPESSGSGPRTEKQQRRMEELRNGAVEKKDGVKKHKKIEDRILDEMEMLNRRRVDSKEKEVSEKKMDEFGEGNKETKKREEKEPAEKPNEGIEKEGNEVESLLVNEINDLREKVIESIKEGDLESAKLLRRDIAQRLNEYKENGAMSQEAINSFLEDWKDLIPNKNNENKSKDDDSEVVKTKMAFDEVMARWDIKDPEKANRVRKTIGIERKEIEKNKVESLRREIKETEAFGEFGVSLDELKKMEGFEALSHGQRLLVAENLKQIILGRIHEEAGEKYKEDTAKARFLGRIWQNISKRYQIAKLEKSTAKDIISGGMEVNGGILAHLIERAGDGPDVEVEKDGSLKMLYVSGSENLSIEEKEVIENFNNIASKFSRVPEEWRFDTASKKEQKEYQDLREQYEKAKAGVLGIKKGEVGDKAAALCMNDIDSHVYGNQNLNTHPDVEEQLQNITDKNVWMHAMANVATERGIYSAAGFITRSVTTGLFGIAGLPLAAAGVGGFMARRRAREVLREHEMEARRGVKDSSSEAKNFVNADQLRGKLEKLAEKVILEENPEKKEKLLTSLRARISYTQGKIEDGLVDYGKGENRFASQYELISSLGAAVSGIEVGSAGESKLEKRLESFLNFKERKISEAQEKYLRNQMIKGAAIAAGFAVAGYALRQFGEEWFGWGKKAGVEVIKAKAAPFTLVDGQSDIRPGGGSSPDGLSSVDSASVSHGALNEQSNPGISEQTHVNTSAEVNPDVVSVVGASSVEDASQELAKEIPAIEYTVKSGDNIWGIIENKLETQGLFEGMEEGQRTHLIDTFKDKITAMSPQELKEIGITSGDPNVLKAGESINLTSVLGDTEALPSAMHASEMLSDVQIEAIEANNIKIADWIASHPNQSITAERIDNILSGGGTETFTPDVLRAADDVMQDKIKNIYEHGFLFFKGSQIEEWTGNPSDGIVGIKDMPVENILKGNFGEPFGGGLDAAQENNREQLLEFLNELKSEIEPKSGETTEEYIRRALADQISATEKSAKILDIETLDGLTAESSGEDITGSELRKNITIENLDVHSEVIDDITKSKVVLSGSLEGYTGTEMLSPDYLNNINTESLDPSLAKDVAKTVSRNLSLEIAAYNQLKSDGMEEKAAVLLNDIHEKVLLYDDIIGKGVIDHSKIPGME